MTEITLNGYYTLILATLVLLLGRVLVQKIKFLADFSIPEPVAGGLVAAIMVYALHLMFGLSFIFQEELKTAFMLMFFASIGLSADFGRLKAGGLPLAIFTVVVSVFIIVQNGVGMVLAKALGLDPLLGLVTGSISLTGGHGTAAAWGKTLENDFGVIGGPVAKRLVNKLGTPKAINRNANKANTAGIGGAMTTNGDNNYNNHTHNNNAHNNNAHNEVFEKSDNIRLITAISAVETLALFALCLAFADIMTMVAKDQWFELPTFVWALAGGVIIRNILTLIFDFDMFDRAIDVFGNASLSLFLAMALLSLKLWDLAGLAGPVLIILLVQTVVMILYAYFITFRIMGKDYDSAVLAAGHCGFGMGATLTAIANMQAITDRYVPSHKAFLIVPMVGAFFVDIVNATILQIFTKLPF